MLGAPAQLEYTCQRLGYFARGLLFIYKKAKGLVRKTTYEPFRSVGRREELIDSRGFFEPLFRRPMVASYRVPCLELLGLVKGFAERVPDMRNSA